MMDKSLYIGLMSGTSVDSIDAAIVDFSTLTPTLIATHNHAWPEALRQELISIGQSGECRLSRLMELNCLTGHEFAQASLALLQKAQLTAHDIVAIGSHGQTLLHQPNAKPAYTLQIGDPNTIAVQTGITTVADFRQRDIVKGGQGAPLAPAFHQAVLRAAEENRVVVNIGGISNITILPKDLNQAVIGFDTGPGNALMNAWIQEHLQQAYDEKGAWAAQGQANDALLSALLSDDYFKLTPPKSTGRDYFNLSWLKNKYGDLLHHLSAKDIQHTLLLLTAHSIAAAIKQYAFTADSVLICGGGVHNTVLCQALQQALPDQHVASTAAYDIDPDWMEAMTFAWLAKQTLNQQAGNLPSVTGADGFTILGGIYPV